MDTKKLSEMLGKMEAMCGECRSMLEEDDSEEGVDEEPAEEEMGEEESAGPDGERGINAKPKNLAIILALKKKMNK